MPKVSVVVPVLNEEDMLAETLETLRAQSFQDFELLVVDNGSIDKSKEIAQEYADRVLEEERRGSVWALHRGFVEARGKFLVSADADTLYPREWLGKMVRVLGQRGVVAAYGPMGFRESPPARRTLEALGCTGLAVLSGLGGVPFAAAANFGFRRAAYFRVGGYPPLAHLASPDFWLALRLKKIGRVKFVPNMVCYTSNRRFTKLGAPRAAAWAVWFWLDVALRRGRLTPEDYWLLVREDP